MATEPTHPSTRPETRAVHITAPEVPGSRPLAVPLYQSSGFAFDEPEIFADGLNRPDGAFTYTRMSNPTTRALENAISGLEGGEAALATGSGMGAINSVLLGVLRTGDHVIAQHRLYGGTFATFAVLADRFGIEVTHISGDDPAEVARAVRPNTKLLYVETIANPTVAVSDLPELFAAGKAAGLTCVVDNTFATPLLCRPIEFGADIVIHSVTKYLAGHSDVVGGIAVFKDAETYRHVWHFAAELGAVADPFASWLTIRGLRTLPLRMRAHCENAEILARRLAEHPAVERVRWPGLEDHPDHATAKRVLDGFGGMLAFDIAGGRDAGFAFTTKLKVAALAPSLGGIETLVLHPASTSHRQLDAEQLAAAGIGEGTIRVSVGVEHPEDLWADFAQALGG